MSFSKRLLLALIVLATAATAAASGRLRTIDGASSAGFRARTTASPSGVVSITDATGDARINGLFDAPGTHVQVSGATTSCLLPLWMVNGSTTLNWNAASYATDEETLLKGLPGSTWTTGGTSQSTGSPNPALPASQDIISASIAQADSQHLRFSVTARGAIDVNSLFEFDMGNYALDLYQSSAGPQMVVVATRAVGFFTKHPATGYQDIVSATGENRNGILHMTLTTAAPIPAVPPASDGEQMRYVWVFQDSQNRLGLTYDRSQGKWLLETRMSVGTFFLQLTPAHGTFSFSGSTLTVDEPVADLDFHTFAWFAVTAVDVTDGPDTFYTGPIDSAPDKLTFTTPPLTIPSFTATPSTIRAGQPATLAWQTQGAASVTIDNGVGTQAGSGTATVTPATTTTYTLTAIQGSSTATATATVTVLNDPIVNVTTFPAPILQPAGAGGVTTTYALTNSGGSATTITLGQSGSFFTQSPATFTLSPGATQTVTITANAQPAGSFEGSSNPSGIGVPPGLQVPVKLLSAAPPSGSVTAEPNTIRVDVAAAAATNPAGSVSFTNHGNATLTGILSSDVSWIIPQSGIVTIAPGQTVTLTFTIDRSKRPDSAGLIGSAEGNLTLSFLIGSGASLAKRPLDASSSIPSVSLVKVVDTVQPAVTVAGIPALAAGEIAIVVPGVGHVTGKDKTTLFVSDVSLLNPQGSQAVDDVKFYYTPASGNPATAKSTSLPSVPGQVSIAIADVVKNIFNGTDEVGTLHIRSKSADKLAVAASVLTSNNPAGTFGNSIPVFRSDRGADNGSAIVLPGVRKDATTHTNLYIQELAGAAANVQIDFLSASGSTISSRNETIDGFKLLQLTDVVPANAVTAIITNKSSTNARVGAYATPVDETSTDTWAIADWTDQLGYAPSEPAIIPVAGSVHGANRTFYRTDVAIANRGSGTASGTLRYIARTGETIDRPINLGAKQSDIIPDVVGSRFNVVGDSVGFLRFTPVTGSFAISSRTFTTIADQPPTFGTGVPVIGTSIMLRAGSSRAIAGLSDASRTTVVASKPGTFRTNFGLMETTGATVTVRVTFRFNFPAGAKAQGIGGASRDYSMNEYQFLLLNSIAGEILGAARLQYGDLTNVEADFQVISGNGAVVLFTSSVDNATGDATLRTE